MDGTIRSVKMVGFFRSHSVGERPLEVVSSASNDIHTEKLMHITNKELSTVASNCDRRTYEMTPLRKYTRLLSANIDQPLSVTRPCREAFRTSCRKPPVPSHFFTPTLPETEPRPPSAHMMSSPQAALPLLAAIIKPPVPDAVTAEKAVEKTFSQLRPQSASLTLVTNANTGLPHHVPTRQTAAARQQVVAIRAVVARRAQGVLAPEGSFDSWDGVVKKAKPF
eukprot:GILI01018515.1.p1 GENE.GILI01018515.1~~GILI01018515.1.p1  ORF type:complete len:223 (+),score=3.61 GILI01018515.1:24-692(+)